MSMSLISPWGDTYFYPNRFERFQVLKIRVSLTNPRSYRSGTRTNTSNRISLVLEENELDTYISGEVPVPEGDEAKSLHKKNLVKAKNIIVDSIKDHLIPQVSSLKTPEEMFDSLTKLFEGKNINQRRLWENSWRMWRSKMQRPCSHTLQGSLKSKNNL